MNLIPNSLVPEGEVWFIDTNKVVIKPKCEHLIIKSCCETVFCENCGFNFSNGEEWLMEEETLDDIIRRNYQCGCDGNR